MDGVVEAPARVHDGQRLVDQRVEQVGGVGQGLTRTRSAPITGNPWPGRRNSASRRQHAPQRLGPLPRVALHLLRVAGVGGGPDEEVAAAEHPRAACQVTVWSSVSPFSWRRAKSTPPTESVQHLVVGAVRVAVLGGPLQVGEAELAPVDDGVVAGREDVAVEAGRQGVVGDHLGRGPALLESPRPPTPAPRRHGRCGRASRPRCAGGPGSRAGCRRGPPGPAARCPCRPAPGRRRWRRPRRWRRTGRSRRRR